LFFVWEKDRVPMVYEMSLRQPNEMARYHKVGKLRKIKMSLVGKASLAGFSVGVGVGIVLPLLR